MKGKCLKLLLLSIGISVITFVGCSKTDKTVSNSNQPSLASYLDSVSYAMVMQLPSTTQYNNNNTELLISLLDEEGSNRARVKEIVHLADLHRSGKGSPLMSQQEAQHYFSIVGQALDLKRLQEELSLIAHNHSSSNIQNVVKYQEYIINFKLDSLSSLKYQNGVAPYKKFQNTIVSGDTIVTSIIAPWILRGNQAMIYGERKITDSFGEPVQILLFSDKLMINRPKKINNGISSGKYYFIINGIQVESTSQDFCSLYGDDYTKLLENAGKTGFKIQVLDDQKSLIDEICINRECESITALIEILK